MPRWTRLRAWLLLCSLVAGAFGVAAAVALSLPLPQGDDFDVMAWEARHVANKWLYLTDRFLTGGLSPEEEDQLLGRYLELAAHIRQADSAEDAGRLIDERDALENHVEAIIEGRLTAVLEDAGLDTSVPLFPDARLVFPPVDFELDDPVRVVTISRRERIELIDRVALRQSFSREEAVALEQRIEAWPDRSALVEAVSGVATYPSLVAPDWDYQRLVETVAHEWVHHYLAFWPLGSRYGESTELRTLNETVANIAAADLADLVVRRFPLSAEAAAAVDSAAPQETAVEVDTVLTDLRLEVEALLAQDRVAAAEALMERRRQELAERGIVFRRINQAFFASRGLYADTGGAIDPIGDKLEELRGRAGSVEAFLEMVAGVSSEAELDAMLAGG
jgi:hypothetical protein